MNSDLVVSTGPGDNTEARVFQKYIIEMREREGRQISGRSERDNRKKYSRNRSPDRSRRRSSDRRSPRRRSTSPRRRSKERRGRSPNRRSKSPIVFNDNHTGSFIERPGVSYEPKPEFLYSPRLLENRYSPPRASNEDFDRLTMIRPELNFQPAEPSFEEPPLQPLDLWSRPESQQLHQEERWNFKNDESWRSNETPQMFISSEDLHPDIPEFGLDARLTSRKWLQIIDNVSLKENWTGDKKKMQLASKLVGPAKEWLMVGDRLMEPWRTFRTAFLKAFKDDMDFFHQLQRMMTKLKSPSESYSNYFTFKTSLLKSCDITGRKAVSCLIGGLDNEELKPMLYDHNFDTPELLFNFLVEQEKNRMVPHNIQGLHPGTKNTNTYSGEERPDILKVTINGVILQAYNDSKSVHVTIKEHHAKLAKLQHNQFRRVLEGHQGSLFTVLGDSYAVIRVGTAVVNMQVFVVPENFQQFPVVIGDSLRQHPLVVFYEDHKGLHFYGKDTTPKDMNSSFAMNQRLVEKMNGMQKNVPPPSTSNIIPPLMQHNFGVPNIGINPFGNEGDGQVKKRRRHR